ncbi:uncharacterized protein LOC111081235 [Drosophila obscura]|uniref:uncharacterized protein LOC111081235 n=1 Tax=Drosophila obscura TaxID=7282 RepID=UPI001BB17C74|nr:uncharacterized protein LOC111081235 [Drosophila obscura]XP_022220215.2 uncharacterized protein LOC111081235 [Drosophila obscura]
METKWKQKQSNPAPSLEEAVELGRRRAPGPGPWTEESHSPRPNGEHVEQPNIKERLNLHVKRRLQQDTDSAVDTTELLPGDPSGSAGKRGKAKEPLKQRKPYQKRAEKNKTETTKCKKATQIASPALEAEPLDEQEPEGSPETTEHKSTSRDRFKNADILNMVLTSKKRALMQDPEVQAFWSRIMAVIKS